jgi:hypothetical protein
LKATNIESVHASQEEHIQLAIQQPTMTTKVNIPTPRVEEVPGYDAEDIIQPFVQSISYIRYIG